MAVLVPDLLIAFEIVWFVLILVGNVGGMMRSLFKQDSSFQSGTCVQDRQVGAVLRS